MNTMNRGTLVLLIVLAFVVVIGVGSLTAAAPRPSGAPVVVDGWGIGASYICGDSDSERPCSVLLPLAQARLDQRDGGHPAVVSAELHVEGPQANGEVPIRTSALFVAVFKLSDGSTRAIGVGYPGVATTPMTFDYGP
jgi:hypothetical protein